MTFAGAHIDRGEDNIEWTATSKDEQNQGRICIGVLTGDLLSA